MGNVGPWVSEWRKSMVPVVQEIEVMIAEEKALLCSREQEALNGVEEEALLMSE
jgi:hypothetical protein